MKTKKLSNRAIITKIFLYAVLWVLICSSNFAYSESIYHFHTQGEKQLEYLKRNDFFFYLMLLATDAKTNTSPPNSNFITRKITSQFEAEMNTVLSANGLGVRTSLGVDNITEKNSQEEDSSSHNTTQIIAILAGLDLTFLNSKGLEIVGGVDYRGFARDERQSQTLVSESTLNFQPMNIWAHRFGLTKRSGNWGGSIYYTNGKESSRTFEKKTELTDASINQEDNELIAGSEEIMIPTIYGIAGEFSLVASAFYLDLASIQAGEGGKKTDNGHTMDDDYLRIIFGFKNLNLSGFVADMRVIHKTLSYSANEFANIDRIPMTLLRTSLKLGSEENHLLLSFLLGIGKDQADVTEYKVKFTRFDLGTYMGIKFTF